MNIDLHDLDNWITGHYGENGVAPNDEKPDLDTIENIMETLFSGDVDAALEAIGSNGLAQRCLRILAHGDREGFSGVLYSLWSECRQEVK